jgi:IS1 family transposase
MKLPFCPPFRHAADPHLRRVGCMNRLPIEKQIKIIATLCEGCSIRATARLENVHRDTVMNLSRRIGEGCESVHDRLFRDLNVAQIQLDELWSYVRKKQKQVKAGDGPRVGEQYIFTAFDPASRCILAFHIGKRDLDNTLLFMINLRGRILNRPQISTDAFAPYCEAIAATFGVDVDYAQIVKSLSDESSYRADWHGSPRFGEKFGIRTVWGSPEPGKTSTSLVERSNLTARQHSRRLARMSNGFSKNFESHVASMQLLVAYYNLCRVHTSIRKTPAMALGVTDHIWSLEELIHAASPPEDLPQRPPPFTLIPGGLS